MAAWTLPASPDARIYREVTNDIARDPDKRRAAIKFRQLCEADFFFFCSRATSLRNYRIRPEDDHPRVGELWIEQPFLFDRCRELQEDSENLRSEVFYNWSRGFFKTTLITDKLTEWELLKQPYLTVCVLTWKLDQAGENMFEGGIKNEFETNDVLKYHWPDVLWQEGESPDLWSADRLNVKRPQGPREPSVSVHGLDSMPVSTHFDIIIGDDCVAQKVVESADATAKCIRMLRRVTALGRSSTRKRWVGTVWDENDPNMQRLKEGVYSRRSHQPMVLPKEANVRDLDVFVRNLKSGAYKTQLVSPSHAIKWRKEMGAYEFSCQCQGIPTARGDQFFLREWVRHYRRRPEVEAQGKAVHIVIDPAGGREDGDFTAIRVQGLGEDGFRYHLDLWRERWGPVETIDLLLGPEDYVESAGWHGPKMMRRGELEAVGLVEKWRPLCVWLEDYAAGGWFDMIERAMKTRGPRFKLRRLPPIKRPKSQRIVLLQPVYEQGLMYYPEHGFGHGSRGSAEDVMDQYFGEEFTKWTMERNSVQHDDMLDSDAWYVQPEVVKLIRFPRKEANGEKAKSLFPWEHRPINQQERRPSFWGR